MVSGEKDDSGLMADLCSGSDRALSELISRWERPLFSFSYRYTQHREDAADIVQESFVRVYRYRHRFRAGAKFSTWLFTIAANLCRNRARWKKRHPSISLDRDEEGEELADRSWHVDSGAVSPDRELARRERVEAVKAAIGELPHDLKTALLLYQYEELSYKEIAGIVGCSVKAVESRLYRARNQLREKLAGHLGEKVGPGAGG